MCLCGRVSVKITVRHRRWVSFSRISGAVIGSDLKSIKFNMSPRQKKRKKEKKFSIFIQFGVGSLEPCEQSVCLLVCFNILMLVSGKFLKFSKEN